MNRKSRLGAVNIVVVLSLLVFVAFTGLAVDIGYLVWVGQQLQTAADASALAGAQHVRDGLTEVQDAAVACAAANRAAGAAVQLEYNAGNADNGDIVVGRFDRDTQIFTATTSSPNAVKVVARRTSGSPGGDVPLFFGPAMSETTGSADIQRTGIAMIGGGTGAGLIVLAESGRNVLTINGNAQVIVDGGAIQVNSDSDQALFINGDTATDAEVINIVGDAKIAGNPILPDIHTDADPIADPLAELPAPAWNPVVDLGTVAVHGEVQAITPGYYSGGITVTGGALTLAPGIYVLDGAGLNVNGGVFTAMGVMFYIVGNGAVDIEGNPILTITPPDPDVYSYPGVDTYEGIAIFQARSNTNEAKIVGTSAMDLEGTYYFPRNNAALSGNAAKFGNQFISYTMSISGNGELTINYDGRFTAPGNRVFLVS